MPVGGASFRHLRTQTFIAGLRCLGLTAAWIVNRPMNRAAFDTYIETQLAPTLSRGDVVILDNLAVHKSKRVAEILQDHGAWFLFLPPYSPDLNPIEMAFSKITSHLRVAQTRTFDVLTNASAQSATSSIDPNAGTSSKRRDMRRLTRKML